MARPFPLQALVDLSADRVEAAERRLQALDRDRREARDKLEQVQNYRREYAERLQQALAGGLGVVQMRDWRVFLARLDEACEQQTNEVASREQAWLSGQAQWLDLRRQQKAFGTLADRHQTAEAQRELKIEQRVQDEFARSSRGGIDGTTSAHRGEQDKTGD
jgi:flagellar protein FliJ